MAQYAQGTTVSAARSRAEIEETLERFGATGFMSGQQDRQALVMFEARGRRIMFRMVLPSADEKRFRLTPTGKDRSVEATRKEYEAETRRMWRSLAMSIKAKLVAVSDGVETFEQAFMAHVVMPDGLTLGDHVAPRIAAAYESGEMPPLLPGPKAGT